MKIFHNFYYVNTYIRFQKTVFCLMSRTTVKLQFPCQKVENFTPDIMIKMISTSVILALLFTVPSLGIFLIIFWHTDNLIMGATIGFSIHFITLGFSHSMSRAITSFFDS